MPFFVSRMISLEKLCLKSISKEFETFHLAFRISNNEILRRNLKFLQRAYTLQLWKELYWKNKIKDEYFDILINEHLEILDCTWFSEQHHQDSIKSNICRLPNLKKIVIGRSGNDDEILENIAKFCPKLIEIEVLYDSHITDTGIKYLCKNETGQVPCPDLSTIYFRNSNVTEDALLHLIKDLPSLKKIDHKGVPGVLYSIHKKNLKTFPSYNLVELDFTFLTNLPYYTDILKVCLNVCPKLKTVSCAITDKKQMDLLNNTSFENLCLFVLDSNLNLNINNYLQGNGCNLVSLSLEDCIVAVKVLSENCPRLKHLDLLNCDFSDVDDHQLFFRHLRSFVFLDKIIDKTYIEAICSILSSSQRLTYVEFVSCNFSLLTEVNLLKIPKIVSKELCFCECKIDIKIIKVLLSIFSCLESLEMFCCDYDDSKQEELSEFIETLSNRPDISYTDYDENEKNRIVEIMSR